jgi:hypothetical protein
MKTHKPRHVPDGFDLTKMFHVKHFGTIASQNLTGPRQRRRLGRGKIDRFFGAIGIEGRRRLDGLTRCRKASLV